MLTLDQKGEQDKGEQVYKKPRHMLDSGAEGTCDMAHPGQGSVVVHPREHNPATRRNVAVSEEIDRDPDIDEPSQEFEGINENSFLFFLDNDLGIQKRWEDRDEAMGPMKSLAKKCHLKLTSRQKPPIPSVLGALLRSSMCQSETMSCSMG